LKDETNLLEKCYQYQRPLASYVVIKITASVCAGHVDVGLDVGTSAVYVYLSENRKK
jgi:hypothetical protein